MPGPLPRLVLSRGKRLAAGHLWIFSNELAAHPKDLAPGSLVEFVDRHGEFLATGYYNPHSLIAGRVLSRRREPVDAGFFSARLAAARALREALYPGADAWRWVFGEADGLPGLILDRYADTLVIQSATAGMDRLLPVLLEALEDHWPAGDLVLRNDSGVRRLEGLAEEKRVIRGGERPRPVIAEGGRRFQVDCLEGQKTGFFLDQRDNRLAFAALAGPGEALDLCSYSGAWGVHLAARGMEVTCVDVSRRALDDGARNAALNDLAPRMTFTRMDVFEFLQAARREGRRYRAIVLDPPAFAKSKAGLRAALKAYRKANGLAMGLLAPGGWLASCSCSYHVAPEGFLDLLRHAGAEQGGGMHLAEYRGQARDHPALLAMPETRYLKCAFLRRR